MTDPLFFLFIGISVLAFGVHSALMASLARRFDALTVSTYRSVSLVFTMAPILLFASWEQILSAREHALTLLLSGAIGAAAFTVSMMGSRYLPIGVASSIRQSTTLPAAMLIGILFLEEYLTLVQAILFAGVALCVIALTWLRSDHAHLDPAMALRGVLLSAIAGSGGALSWYFFSLSAREIHPFVAAYFVEAAVGFFTLLYFVILRSSRLHAAEVRLPANVISKVVLVGALTIFATASYAVGINHGPYPLATGLMMSGTLISTVIAWLFFKEHLKRIQIVLIIIAVILMALVKMNS